MRVLSNTRFVWFKGDLEFMTCFIVSAVRTCFHDHCLHSVVIYDCIGRQAFTQLTLHVDLQLRHVDILNTIDSFKNSDACSGRKTIFFLFFLPLNYILYSCNASNGEWRLTGIRYITERKLKDSLTSLSNLGNRSWWKVGIFRHSLDTKRTSTRLPASHLGLCSQSF